MLKRLALFALFFVVLFATSGVWSVYKKERDTAKRRGEAAFELSELAARRQKLQGDIDTLETDRGLEETLRAQYGLAVEGEGLIVIVDSPTPKQAVATSTLRDWFRSVFWRF